MAVQVPFPRTPRSSGSEPSLQGIMFRPAVLLDLAGLLGLAGRLDLSGLLILTGTSWQLMQHSLTTLLINITNVEISNFNFPNFNF